MQSPLMAHISSHETAGAGGAIQTGQEGSMRGQCDPSPIHDPWDTEREVGNLTRYEFFQVDSYNQPLCECMTLYVRVAYWADVHRRDV